MRHGINGSRSRRPARLQPERQLRLKAERAQRLHIFIGGRLHDPQHQPGDALANRDFDLRHLLGDRQRADERTERIDEATHGFRQHRTGPHIGQQSGTPLTESNDRAPTLG